MTDDDMTGPWALASGTLAVGVGAVAVKALRRHDDERDRKRHDGGRRDRRRNGSDR